MKNEHQIKLIETYFKMWIERDFSRINDIFADDIFYRECYGACYRNLKEIHLWITQQLKKQVVLNWSINTVNVDNNSFFRDLDFSCKRRKMNIFLTVFHELNLMAILKYLK